MKAFALVILLFSLHCAAATLPPLVARDLVSGNGLEHNWPAAPQGSVLVFLSSNCPCSNAHIAHLTALAHRFPQVKFIGVHANADESKSESAAYFKAQKLPFPVLQDSGAQWANRLKALRTPHAFVVSASGELLYQGGVTSSAEASKAQEFYLEAALTQLVAGEKITTAKTRVLGCQIARP